MRLIKKPFQWVSAHRDIDFEFDFQGNSTFAIFTVGVEFGKAVFSFEPNGIYTPVVGQKFISTNPNYPGTQTVIAVGSFTYLGITYQTVTTTANFTVPSTGGSITFPEDVSFAIWRGGGGLWPFSPFTFVTEFKPEINPTGKVVFNICGYVNKLFDVIDSGKSFQLGGIVVKPNLFDNIDIYARLSNGTVVYLTSHYILNSALDSRLLNRDYVDTGRNLNDFGGENFYFSCGETENIQIKNGFVQVVGQYVDGVSTFITPYFSADFDSDFQH